jgi:prolyl oligopeptidase
LVASSPEDGNNAASQWQGRTMSMIRNITAILLILIGNSAYAAARDDFAALLGDAWEWQLRENPVMASSLGDRRYNDRWQDSSLESVASRQEKQREFNERLLAIDSSQLDDNDQLNYELFRRALMTDIEGFRFRDYLMPINQRGGVQTLDEVAERIRLTTVADFDDWLKRMASIETVLDQTMALQEEGRKRGYMPPKILMQRVPDQIAAQLVENAEDSPFYKTFRDLPDSIPAAEQERLRAEARAVIDDSVVPAYREFSRYFGDTYLPASRDSIDASSLPDGRAFYEYRTRVYTTTGMTPDEIHRLGLSEVQRIRGEMQLVIDELEFAGSFEDFLEFLRTDPQFYYETPEQLFDAYLAICKRIDPELVKLFGVLPRMPYGLRPIPDNIAPDTTTAYYSRPAADGSRAGYYYVNLYKPEVRPKYEMEVLSVHEAMPGHHLQIALQMELGDMPAFRRYSGFTAFTEGWGLYSESLGYDLGLYKDPYSRFGALTYEMWRAVRLVVDTGMHYKGWTRQQAIDFFKANAAKTELDITNEIDRYIGWPGQALAYKIGQLKMLELRRNAEQTLGDQFDIRAFHDALLGGGALPLEVLDARMHRWLTDQIKVD